MNLTAHEYAAVLVHLVRSDMADDPTGFADAACWQDLHDVVDANEYVTCADELVGVVSPALIDDEWEAYAAFIDKAIKLAEAELWPKACPAFTSGGDSCPWCGRHVGEYGWMRDHMPQPLATPRPEFLSRRHV